MISGSNTITLRRQFTPELHANFTDPEAQHGLSTVPKTFYENHLITYNFPANQILVDEQLDAVLQWKDSNRFRIGGDDGLLFKRLQ